MTRRLDSPQRARIVGSTQSVLSQARNLFGRDTRHLAPGALMSIDFCEAALRRHGLSLVSGHRPGGDLSTGVEAELVEDVLDVVLGGPRADVKALSDGAIRKALGHQSGDLLLSVREKGGTAKGVLERLELGGDRPGKRTHAEVLCCREGLFKQRDSEHPVARPATTSEYAGQLMARQCHERRRADRGRSLVRATKEVLGFLAAAKQCCQLSGVQRQR